MANAVIVASSYEGNIMRAKVLKAADKPPKDAAYVVIDGVPTNAPIHDAIMDGVDDSACRSDSYERVKAAGGTPGMLALLS